MGTFLYACMVAFGLWLIENNTAAALDNLAAVADTVTTNLGRPQVYPGTKGGPIFIIRENHASYLSNLEEAAILLRLEDTIKLVLKIRSS
jgi:hypothetical protein